MSVEELEMSIGHIFNKWATDLDMPSTEKLVKDLSEYVLSVCIFAGETGTTNKTKQPPHD